ncbi:MAG: SPOR domain-containing protein [Bacteroidales bacterium]|jgi:hypothetical protein
MKIEILSAFIMVFLLPFFGLAQQHLYKKTDEKPFKQEGKVEIFRDNRVDSTIKMHIRYNSVQHTFDGYRIQIFFDAGNNSLNGAQAAAANFQMLFPGDTAYISFNEPYYKVRVGDFRTRLEAESYLQQILPDFPNAFIIKDKILFPKMDDE